MAQPAAINFPDLRNYPMDQLILATNHTPSAIAWARQHGLLATGMMCDSEHCKGQNRQMVEVGDKRADVVG